MPINSSIITLKLLHPMGAIKKRYKKSLNFVKMYSPQRQTTKERLQYLVQRIYIYKAILKLISILTVAIYLQMLVFCFFINFVDKLGLHQLLKNSFKTNDNANRQHLDDAILLQKNLLNLCRIFYRRCVRLPFKRSCSY